MSRGNVILTVLTIPLLAPSVSLPGSVLRGVIVLSCLVMTGHGASSTFLNGSLWRNVKRGGNVVVKYLWISGRMISGTMTKQGSITSGRKL